MKGADCETDHHMVRSSVAFSVRRAYVRNKAKAPNRLDTSKIKDKQTKAQLKKEMNRALRECEVNEQNTDVELQWKALRMVVYNTAEKVYEKLKRKHQDWFDETDKRLNDLLQQRNNARINILQTNTQSNKSKYTAARRNLQQYSRKVKSD